MVYLIKYTKYSNTIQILLHQIIVFICIKYKYKYVFDPLLTHTYPHTNLYAQRPSLNYHTPYTTLPYPITYPHTNLYTQRPTLSYPTLPYPHTNLYTQRPSLNYPTLPYPTLTYPTLP